jgi:hypothetical protein
MQLEEEVARLRQLLEQEQANHRAFRLEIYSDREFAPIFQRRIREEQQRHLNQRLLDKIDELREEIEGLRKEFYRAMEVAEDPKK